MKLDQSNTIAWEEVGTPIKGTIIFLHAMAGSATAWAPQMSAFKDEYRCIAWDMPGFGETADAPDDADMDDIVAMLAAFFRDDLVLTSAHFVGLSVGGMILQHFAATHGDLVQCIAILDSSPKFAFGNDVDPASFADPILEDLSSGTTPTEFSNTMIRAIVGPHCSEEVKLSTIASMSRARPTGLALTTRLIAHHDAVAKLSDITCPTLVIAGADDAETPPAYAYAIASRIAGASVTIIPKAGHIVNLEAPEMVTERLRFFFDHAL